MKIPQEYQVTSGLLSTDGASYTIFENNEGKRILGSGRENEEQVVCHCNGTAQEVMDCFLTTKQFEPMVNEVDGDVRAIEKQRILIKHLCGGKTDCAEHGMHALARKAVR